MIRIPIYEILNCCATWYRMAAKFIWDGISLLVPGKYGSYLKCVILQYIVMIDMLSIFSEIVLRWIPQDFPTISWNIGLGNDLVLSSHIVPVGASKLRFLPLWYQHWYNFHLFHTRFSMAHIILLHKLWHSVTICEHANGMFYCSQ